MSSWLGARGDWYGTGASVNIATDSTYTSDSSAAWQWHLSNLQGQLANQMYGRQTAFDQALANQMYGRQTALNQAQAQYDQQYARYTTAIPWQPPRSQFFSSDNHGVCLEREAAAFEQRDRAFARARARKDEADKRADALLCEFLSEKQREQYAYGRFFEVLSADGRRLYRLRHGWAGNVDVINVVTGRVVEHLCIHPDRPVPIADSLLAQKLMIETAEDSFRSIANITPAA